MLACDAGEFGGCQRHHGAAVGVKAEGTDNGQADGGRTRHRGYGENYGCWNTEERIASIAVPIRGQQQLLGCLNVVYVAKAMSIEQAVARYLPALQRTALRIEQEASSTVGA